MKSLFRELAGTYTSDKDGIYYPNLTIEETDQRPIGKWGMMHREYLEAKHPSLYQRLIKVLILAHRMKNIAFIKYT
ncbi:MAG: TnpV protein [Clostridia bacterium]|nr:TnpV protein [Clostridia bacterium]